MLGEGGHQCGPVGLQAGGTRVNQLRLWVCCFIQSPTPGGGQYGGLAGCAGPWATSQQGQGLCRAQDCSGGVRDSCGG